MFDREKFKRLVHYVVARAGDRDGFGATKLYKVLWFSDARAYMLDGKPITGESYWRGERGPVPRHGLSVIDELALEGAIGVWMDRYYDLPIRRFKALMPPDRGFLSEKERRTVDWWIEHIANDHTATSISDQSHDYAWEIAAPGEPIPYHAIFANRGREPRGDELEWARAQARQLGLS